VSTDGKLDKELLSKVKMPNRDGFIPEQVFKLDNEPEASPNRGSAPQALAGGGRRSDIAAGCLRVTPESAYISWHPSTLTPPA
jgi:hypothetical protein